MSKVLALKFLILQTLNKNKTQIESNLHTEIAKSLNIVRNEESLLITWIARSKNKEILVDDKKFSFYIKSEFDNISNTSQIETNESNARNLTLKIIKLSL